MPKKKAPDKTYSIYEYVYDAESNAIEMFEHTATLNLTKDVYVLENGAVIYTTCVYQSSSLNDVFEIASHSWRYNLCKVEKLQVYTLKKFDKARMLKRALSVSLNAVKNKLTEVTRDLNERIRSIDELKDTVNELKTEFDILNQRMLNYEKQP